MLAKKMMEKQSTFLALLSRMDRVIRWNKSRPSFKENLNDHSLHTAYICLLLGLVREQRNATPVICPNELAMFGAFHDSSECLTEDINGVYKTKNKDIHKLFKIIESDACDNLLYSLPDELQAGMKKFMRQDLADSTIKELVKSADILHALTKAKSEIGVGCTDFIDALNELEGKLIPYREKYPEVQYIYDYFINSFSDTFDTLIGSLPSKD